MSAQEDYHETLLRLTDAEYGDGVGGLGGAGRPSAREISNAVFDQGPTDGNSHGFSDFVWIWGQFLDHDLSHTPTQAGVEAETAPISVPLGDAHFDPFATGRAEIGFTRSQFVIEEGQREQINAITSAIDGSQIYGSDPERLASLRNDDGTMKMSETGYLPVSTGAFANDRGADPAVFMAGDVRANENLALTSMHTIFAREHNRLVEEYRVENPDATGDALFERARETVEATLQAITYREFLPLLLGEDALAAKAGPGAETTISTEFSTAGFRLGHTMLSPTLYRMDEAGAESAHGNLALRHAFFQPARLEAEGGVEDLMRGAGANEAQEIDHRIIDDVRNFLFGPPGAGGFDLASLNIQRGRDHGLADYNTTREALGLERAESFADITTDPDLQIELAALYTSVDDVDLYVGGLAEAALPGAAIGETFHAILADQFQRLRDGDASFATNLDDMPTLATIIERNTDVDAMQDDAFSAFKRKGGTDADDLLRSPDSNTLLLGLGGNDILLGSNAAGTEQLEGGAGDDRIYASDGTDILDGGTGNDQLHGEGGADHLRGGAGDDFLVGGDDGDTLDGGAGNDVLLAGHGHDTVVFSAGDDVMLDFAIWDDVIDLNDRQAADLDLRAFDTGALLTDTASGDTLWLAGVVDAQWITLQSGNETFLFADIEADELSDHA